MLPQSILMPEVHPKVPPNLFPTILFEHVNFYQFYSVKNSRLITITVTQRRHILFQYNGYHRTQHEVYTFKSHCKTHLFPIFPQLLTRDVKIVFFQKSIIVSLKSIFYRLS